MLRARHLCCALLLASCADHAAPPDHATGGKTSTAGPAGGDPWSGGSAKPKGGDLPDSAGFDLKGTLAKIAENLTKPGPYEAPTQSPDFDEAKPHWGVLTLSGAVVERQALSLFGGGHSVELRALILRLRELASDDKLTGVFAIILPRCRLAAEAQQWNGFDSKTRPRWSRKTGSASRRLPGGWWWF